MFHKENQRNNRKSSFIFTSRRHPEKGIMSAILGVISIISIIAAVYLSYKNGGNAKPQYGAAVFLVTLFALTGMVLGVMSRLEKENYHLFPHLGIGLNFLSLAMISFILYSGI